MNIGLRIDVDTYRGTKTGVPNLCKLLGDHDIKATFFFSVGPDNMGRNLWRLLNPKFFSKMLRTKAANLYGWDILLKGTFWPGPVIGKKLAPIIRSVALKGHEIGLHAWDHHRWQNNIHKMNRKAIDRSIKKAYKMLSKILGNPPQCSAAPAWKCNETVLKVKQHYPFKYNSDCRGQNIFMPLADTRLLAQPQIPVTLPTYDELVGQNSITEKNYNDHLISLLKPESLNVLTIHAEAEGIACLKMFERFIKKAHKKGYTFKTLEYLLQNQKQINSAKIVQRNIPGRQGTVAYEQSRNDTPERQSAK